MPRHAAGTSQSVHGTESVLLSYQRNEYISFLGGDLNCS